ncbi:MAG: hypothetical protein LBK41_08750 [Clostridiales bacterium]|jgi:hypothetical protein|nr:hypothetical protein [Clostridiales bacterium]
MDQRFGVIPYVRWLASAPNEFYMLAKNQLYFLPDNRHRDVIEIGHEFSLDRSLRAPSKLLTGENSWPISIILLTDFSSNKYTEFFPVYDGCGSTMTPGALPGGTPALALQYAAAITAIRVIVHATPLPSVRLPSHKASSA